MTSYDIRTALKNRYSDNRRYAIAEEVGLSTGYAPRRLDMMIFDCFESNRFRIDGIEIKISTSDLKHELIDPDKHAVFFEYIDYYTIACPKGVVDPILDVIPKNWGILIINEDLTTRYKRKPLALHDSKSSDRFIPRNFFASVVRNIQLRQPSELELQDRYDKGFEDGERSVKSSWDYNKSRVAKDIEKLKAYDALEARFDLWGENIEQVLDEFESFRKSGVKYLSSNIDALITRLSAVNKYLNEMLNCEEATSKNGQ